MISTRAAMQRSRWIARPLFNSRSIWTGAPSSSSSSSSLLHRSRLFHLHPTHVSHPTRRRHDVLSNKPLQRRNYIFLPSTFDDMIKLTKSQSSNDEERIKVKLSTRWHDQLAAVLDRYDALLRRTTLVSPDDRSSPVPTPPTASSSKATALSTRYDCKSLDRLLTHYNAKKRVYASATRKTFKNFRRMNASEAKLYRDRYYVTKKLRLHQMLNRLRLRAERKGEQWRDWWMNAGGGKEALVKLAPSDSNNGGGRPDRNDDDGVKATWKSLTLTEPAQSSWFDAEGYPLTSREETGRFVNPWLSQSTNGENGLKKFLRWKASGWMKKLGFDLNEDRYVTRSGTSIDTTKEWNGSAASIYRHETRPYAEAALVANVSTRQTIRLSWLGHATTLVTFPGNFTILTDPHFSNYAGPMKRNDPPPMGVMGLPDVDCVLISHDHMDHLDYWSILDLIDSNKVKFWVVPLGIKEWLIVKAGVPPEDIVELEWWEGVRITKKAVTRGDVSESVVSPEVEGLVRAFDTSTGQALNNNRSVQMDRNEMVITCAPAQHWCSRTPFDRNRRLWCSWAVHSTPSVTEDPFNTISQTHSFYFAGDTGLPPEFPLHHQIGDRLGPFDLAAIPIGAYEPRWFMRESHCNPAEAVEIHQAIRSRRSVAIHFDTFNLADEPQTEPPRFLVEEVERVNEEIVRLAAEVAAVADEVSVVIGKETSAEVATVDGQMIGENDCSIEKRSLAKSGTTGLVEILPPLVDFAVIQQGHCIESLPKKNHG